MTYVRNILEKAYQDLVTKRESNEFLYDKGIRSQARYIRRLRQITNDINQVKDCFTLIQE